MWRSFTYATRSSNSARQPSTDCLQSTRALAREQPAMTQCRSVEVAFVPHMVNHREMMRLRMPIIAAVIGEGGSGGALGIGVADHVLILENAYYSVISPEACFAVLWRDRRHAAEAAEALKLTAQDLLKLEVVDEIIAEPEGGAHRDYDSIAANLSKALRGALQQVSQLPVAELLEKRYQKFRRLGVFSEGKTVTASAHS